MIFNLSVRYKTGKTNIVSNALFRLQDSSFVIKNSLEILKALHDQVEKERFIDFMRFEIFISYYITLIKILENFKSRLIKAYVKNKQ